MKKLLTLFALAGGFSVITFFVSYRWLNAFFNATAISINQWLDIEEWVTLTINYQIKFIGESIWLLFLTWLALYFNTDIEKQKNKKGRDIRRLAIFQMVFVVLIPLLGVLYHLTQVLYSTAYDYLVFSVGLIVFWILAFLKNHFKNTPPKIESLFIFTVVQFIFMVFHPTVHGKAAFDTTMKNTTFTSVKLRTKCYDSLIYLSGSKKYFFLISPKNHTSYIVRKDSVINLTWQSKTQKIIIE